jgi:hypothetical protein
MLAIIGSIVNKMSTTATVGRTGRQPQPRNGCEQRREKRQRAPHERPRLRELTSRGLF